MQSPASEYSVKSLFIYSPPDAYFVGLLCSAPRLHHRRPRSRGLITRSTWPHLACMLRPSSTLTNPEPAPRRYRRHHLQYFCRRLLRHAIEPWGFSTCGGVAGVTREQQQTGMNNPMRVQRHRLFEPEASTHSCIPHSCKACPSQRRGL